MNLLIAVSILFLGCAHDVRAVNGNIIDYTDAQPLPILVAAAGGESSGPIVATDGSVMMVVWREQWVTGGHTILYAATTTDGWRWRYAPIQNTEGGYDYELRALGAGRFEVRTRLASKNPYVALWPWTLTWDGEDWSLPQRSVEQKTYFPITMTGWSIR